MLNNQLWVFTLVFLLLSVPGYGQKQSYKGPYKTLTGLSGVAEFQFVEKGKTRIKDGDFTFRSTSKDTEKYDRFNNYNWSGTYDENQKSGKWSYSQVKHDFELQGITDFKPDYQLYSQVINQKIQFQNGLPVGEMVFYRNELINGDSTDEQLQVTTTFKSGKIHGSFLVEGSGENSGKIKIEGQAENGLMIGDWKFTYLDEEKLIEEFRSYQSGILNRVVKVSEGDTLTAVIYPHSPKISNYLSDGSNYDDLFNIPLSLQFDDGYPSVSPYSQLQQEANGYLEEILTELFRNEYLYFQKNGLALGTNRMAYPLSESEENAVVEWKDYDSRLGNSLEQLNDLDLEDFTYLENDTLHLIHAWYKEQMKLLSKIQPWKSIILADELGYYYREGQLLQYVKETLGSDSLTYDGRQEVISYAPLSSLEKSFIFYFSQNMAERAFLGDSLSKVSNKIVSRQIRQNEVNLRTLNVGKKLVALDSALSQVKPESETDRIKAYLHEKFVENLFKKSLKEIGHVTDAISKAGLLDTLEQQILVSQDIIRMLDGIEKAIPQLDELYTVYQFDPYTFSENVPVRLYRKLYERVAEDFLKENLRQATKKQNLNAVYTHVEQAYESLQRLKELIQLPEEADQINKEVKKNTTSQKLMELLEI